MPSWLAVGEAGGGALVGDQVALAVDDRLVIQPFDRLHDVGALADDRRDLRGRAVSLLGDRHLLGARLALTYSSMVSAPQCMFTSTTSAPAPRSPRGRRPAPPRSSAETFSE